MKPRILAFMTTMIFFVWLALPAPSPALDHPQPNLPVHYIVFNLGTLGGSSGAGDSINNRGWVTGVSNLAGNTDVHATLWTYGSRLDLKTLGGANAQPGAVAEPAGGPTGRGPNQVVQLGLGFVRHERAADDAASTADRLNRSRTRRKSVLGMEAEVGQVKLIHLILAARRIDCVDIPPNEKATGAGAGPAKRDLKDMMKPGEGGVAVDPKAAPGMRAGIRNDEAEPIDLGTGGCIAHGHKERSPSSFSFHELFALPPTISDSPHASAPNTSPRPRRTLILSYRPADTFPAYVKRRGADLEARVRRVRGKNVTVARFTMTSFPIPRYPKQTKSLDELQEMSRAGIART